MAQLATETRIYEMRDPKGFDDAPFPIKERFPELGTQDRQGYRSKRLYIEDGLVRLIQDDELFLSELNFHHELVRFLVGHVIFGLTLEGGYERPEPDIPQEILDARVKLVSLPFHRQHDVYDWRTAATETTWQPWVLPIQWERVYKTHNGRTDSETKRLAIQRARSSGGNLGNSGAVATGGKSWKYEKRWWAPGCDCESKEYFEEGPTLVEVPLRDAMFCLKQLGAFYRIGSNARIRRLNWRLREVHDKHWPWTGEGLPTGFIDADVDKSIFWTSDPTAKPEEKPKKRSRIFGQREATD